MAESKKSSARNTLYLVDISSFIFRAFFAIRSLSNKRGEPTNAVYGVATMLARLIEEADPEYLAVVYDSKEPSFRKEIYEDYKANRSEAPPDLIPQFDRIEDLVRLMGLHSYRFEGVEADDLIATLTKRWCASDKDRRVTVVTSDKDLMQLVDDRVAVWDTMSNQVYGPIEVEAKYGVRPDQIRDFLGLTGDTSDNIPGVPSIGPKTATTLLKEFENLEGVLTAAKAGKISGKKGEVLVSHEKDARLSAELASLQENLPVEIPLEQLRYQFQITPECIAFLKDLDFHSLVTKWSKYHTEGAPEAPIEREIPVAHEPGSVITLSASIAPDPGNRFRLINTEKGFQEVLAGMERAKKFGFDLETTSLNPRQAELVGVAICYDPAFGCYIPVGHRGTDVPQLPEKEVLSRLKPFLESTKYGKIGQNLKYDWSVLRALGLNPTGVEADTMIAAYVLEPEGRHNLETLAAHYLSYAVTTYEQLCGKGKDQIGFDQVPVDQACRYSAEDAWIAVQLWNTLEPKLKAEGLVDLLRNVDLPLVDVLSEMESQGVCIDEDWLSQLSKRFEKELRGIEERIGAYTKGPINLNSPKQLGHLLFEELKLPSQGKTKTGFSTDAKVLDALAPLHEVPRLLLEYREISKLKGTYVDPLPGMKDAKTGKIHAGFHQTVAATGRLSSSDPNLQNIPIRSERGKLIRRAFIPSQGNCLLSADYSQIELRILAHMSGDPDLSASFRKDEDVHRRTASEIYRVSLDEVTDRQRNIAKAINFGLMYGKTAFGLASELKISRTEAQDIIDRYFKRYLGVKRFLDQQVLDAKEKGWVSTLLGRKRFLPDIRAANPAVRNNAERMAMNTPIQGTAADMMKLAMIEIAQKIKAGGFESRLIIQVHDEFLLDCPRNEVERVQKMVVETMEGAMKLDVPLKVNANVGDNWMEL